MTITRPRPAARDARGVITDVLDGVPVECVTILTTRKGAIRGNHYHRKTTQYAYILTGRFRVHTQRPGERKRSRVAGAGALVVTPPHERHAFEALEDSTMIACAHGPRSGRSYEADTFRLDVPLVGPGAKRAAR